MAATLFGWTGLAAQETPVDLLPLLLPEWNRVFALRTGAGYKDNLTYSANEPEASPFVAFGGEAFVSRTPSAGAEWTLFASADLNRYLARNTVGEEALAFGQAQVKRTLLENFQGLLALDYFFTDRVLDVSVTETNRQAIPVKGHRLTPRPGLRLSITPQAWVAMEMPAARQWLSEPLDDYWEFGPRFTVGRTYGHASEASLTYQVDYRYYDTRTEVSLMGESIPGTHRRYTQRELGGVWRHHWDEQKRWRSATRVSFRWNEDLGSGYFDYRRISASHQLRFYNGVWELMAEARVSFYDFPVQTVSDTNREKRERKELYLGLRCERQITDWFKLVAAYEYERTLSNDALETYTANTFSGGVQWEF